MNSKYTCERKYLALQMKMISWSVTWLVGFWMIFFVGKKVFLPFVSCADDFFVILKTAFCIVTEQIWDIARRSAVIKDHAKVQLNPQPLCNRLMQPLTFVWFSLNSPPCNRRERRKKLNESWKLKMSFELFSFFDRCAQNELMLVGLQVFVRKNCSHLCNTRKNIIHNIGEPTENHKRSKYNWSNNFLLTCGSSCFFNY